jgi:hypothetical protein
MATADGTAGRCATGRARVGHRNVSIIMELVHINVRVRVDISHINVSVRTEM